MKRHNLASSFLFGLLGCLPLAFSFNVASLRRQPNLQRSIEEPSIVHPGRNIDSTLSASKIILTDVSYPNPSSFYLDHEEELSRRIETADAGFKSSRNHVPSSLPPYFVDVGTKRGSTASFTFGKQEKQLQSKIRKFPTIAPPAPPRKKNTNQFRRKLTPAPMDEFVLPTPARSLKKEPRVFQRRNLPNKEAFPTVEATFPPVVFKKRSSPPDDNSLFYLDEIKSIAASTAASTAAMTMTAMLQQHQSQSSSTEYVLKLEKRLETLEHTLASLLVTKQAKESAESASATIGTDTTAMQRQLNGLERDLTEVRDYETVTIHWKIPEFENQIRPSATTTFTSEPFQVASFPMNLELRIEEACDENDYLKRNVGFYIMHKNNESKKYQPNAPIYLGGTKMEIGKLERAFSDTAAIERHSNDGWGWDKFLTLDDVRENYVQNGQLKIQFTVRVKRSMDYNVDVAMVSD